MAGISNMVNFPSCPAICFRYVPSATTNAENPTNTWHVNFNNGPREHQQEEWMAGTMGESEWSFPDVILCWCDVSACFKKDIFS